MKYEKLYSLDSTGKIRVWYMEQQDNLYRTISGLIDGKLVESEWTEVFGKNYGKTNETTDTEQATKEILAKYKKQLKTGYFNDINKVGQLSYVEPMLAQKFNDRKDKRGFWDTEWGIQCKLNGNRCIATKDGLFTRKGERVVSCPHIERSLQTFFRLYPNAVLDGELFNEDLRQQLNELAKLIRKTVNITKEDLKKSEKLVSYYVYDGYGFNNTQYVMDENTRYKFRKEWIEQNVQYHYIKHVKTSIVKNIDEMNVIYDDFISQEHEGVMLRDLNSPYEHKRSKYLLKLKPDDDAEFEILDISEGSGNWAGLAKIITLKMFDGKVFDATFKGNMDEALQCLQERKKWIGKIVTIKYNGLTGKGTPNYAQFDWNNQPHLGEKNDS